MEFKKILMQKYQTIILEIENQIATITLNRPEVKNAINNIMMDELSDAFEYLKSGDLEAKKVRVIILKASSNVFSSGADLNWLIQVNDYTFQENLTDSAKLMNLLNLINTHPKATICILNGSAVGGGVGLLLSCDIILSVENAEFGVSQVAYGIVPAAIIKQLIERIGLTKARELLITGKRISAKNALEIGMINYVDNFEAITNKANDLAKIISQNGPIAISKVKEMIYKVFDLNSFELDKYIAEVIAELRVSQEGKEGIRAFLSKEKPNF